MFGEIKLAGTFL